VCLSFHDGLQTGQQACRRPQKFQESIFERCLLPFALLIRFSWPFCVIIANIIIRIVFMANHIPTTTSADPFLLAWWMPEAGKRERNGAQNYSSGWKSLLVLLLLPGLMSLLLLLLLASQKHNVLVLHIVCVGDFIISM